jgi:hypothetical protein
VTRAVPVTDARGVFVRDAYRGDGPRPLVITTFLDQ